MKFTKNDEAVSPVIGVILMVAITVILAAVIAAFVFGMAGNIQKTKVVSVTTARTTSNTVVATYQGGQDASALESVTFSVNGVEDTSGTMGSRIGNSYSITAAGPNSHIVGVASFTDGSKQVVVDTTL